MSEQLTYDPVYDVVDPKDFRRTIDYLFWRAALLFGALGVLATLAAFLLMRLGRSRQPAAMSHRME